MPNIPSNSSQRLPFKLLFLKVSRGRLLNPQREGGYTLPHPPPFVRNIPFCLATPLVEVEVVAVVAEKAESVAVAVAAAATVVAVATVLAEGVVVVAASFLSGILCVCVSRKNFIFYGFNEHYEF